MKLRVLIMAGIGALIAGASHAQSPTVCPDNFMAYAQTSQPVLSAAFVFPQTPSDMQSVWDWQCCRGNGDFAGTMTITAQTPDGHLQGPWEGANGGSVEAVRPDVLSHRRSTERET